MTLPLRIRLRLNLFRIWEILPCIVCELINVICNVLCSSLGFHVDKAFWLPFMVGKPFMVILNGA